MTVALKQPWTAEQFLAWAAVQEGRYEFDGVRPVAMTGGSSNHDRITGNIYTSLRQRLRGTPCSNHGPNLGVQTIVPRVRYPDALITCTKFAGTSRLAPNPVIVFEVLSATSGGTDRIEKVREYQAVPSILRYIIVESATAGLQVLYRAAGNENWITLALVLEDMLSLPEAGIEIPVAEFYEDVEFDEVSVSG